ncbi:hypothetical protein D6C92_04481 [Aureobasidium pullulans]|nr:hypothetical protein D6C92_04481 [Aureobasidium pullulans]
MSYNNLQLSPWIGGDQESGWLWLDPTHGACSDGRRLLQTKDFIYGLVLSFHTHKVLIMKLSFFLLTIAISGVMMSPTINKRQNDVQKCVKGQGDMKGKAYDGPVNNCKKECFLNEGPDQPNAGLLCKGYCRVVGHPAPISECRDHGLMYAMRHEVDF